jgi:DNA segregation ATPase FtsK/SpoIIIE-like protein
LRSNPHTLIAGLTGSGKSVLQNCIVEQLCRKGYTVHGIDMKRGIELNDFGHKINIIDDYKPALELLDFIVEEMNKRYDMLKLNTCKDIQQFNDTFYNDRMKRIAVVIDEMSELFNNKQYKDELTERLTSIIRLGRAAGIHLIAATQRPSSMAFSTEIRSQFSNKICGYMSDNQSSIMVLGNKRATHLDKNAKGRFILNNTEFQAYYFKSDMIKKGTKDKLRIAK